MPQTPLGIVALIIAIIVYHCFQAKAYGGWKKYLETVVPIVTIGFIVLVILMMINFR